MGTTPLHRITDAARETNTGTCAVCGPDTRVRWVAHRNRWACGFVERRNRRNRKPRTATPEETRRQNLRKKFGITEEQYDEMLAAQGGVCAICLGACTTGWRLAVDHDHESGRIRGLLCGRCNRGLGLFYDNPEQLQAAIKYLTQNH